MAERMFVSIENNTKLDGVTKPEYQPNLTQRDECFKGPM